MFDNINTISKNGYISIRWVINKDNIRAISSALIDEGNQKYLKHIS